MCSALEGLPMFRSLWLVHPDELMCEAFRKRFAGLPNVQAAELLGVPERTAKRAWAYARAWLYQEICKKL